MRRKKVWIVTELFYPEETAVAYIFTRIANHLASSYKVGVICGPEFYDKGKTNYVDNVEIVKSIDIHRIKYINLDKNSLVQRTIKIILLSFRMGFLMWREISKGELVILSTNPAPLLLIVRIIKYVKKFQLHILVHDVFPENAIPAKIFNNNESCGYKFIKYFFDRAYSCADHLIVIGRDMKEIMTTKVNRCNKKPQISIVPNWSNIGYNHLSYSKHNTDKIILTYAGNIGRVQGLLDILNAFRLSNNNNISFNIHGTGALYPEIEKFINRYKIENIYLKGSFSRNEEKEILANSDIGIVSLSNGMYGLGVPSKSYHLLSAGKPILYIGVPETEISCLVLENGIGWSLDIRNQNEMITFFINLSSVDKLELKKMGEKARFLAEKYYAENLILDLLQSKIESVELNSMK